MGEDQGHDLSASGKGPGQDRSESPGEGPAKAATPKGGITAAGRKALSIAMKKRWAAKRAAADHLDGLSDEAFANFYISEDGWIRSRRVAASGPFRRRAPKSSPRSPVKPRCRS